MLRPGRVSGYVVVAVPPRHCGVVVGWPKRVGRWGRMGRDGRTGRDGPGSPSDTRRGARNRRPDTGSAFALDTQPKRSRQAPNEHVPPGGGRAPPFPAVCGHCRSGGSRKIPAKAGVTGGGGGHPKAATPAGAADLGERRCRGAWRAGTSQPLGPRAVKAVSRQIGDTEVGDICPPRRPAASAHPTPARSRGLGRSRLFVQMRPLTSFGRPTPTGPHPGLGAGRRSNARAARSGRWCRRGAGAASRSAGRVGPR
jgi:hypothetical protein